MGVLRTGGAEMIGREFIEDGSEGRTGGAMGLVGGLTITPLPAPGSGSGPDGAEEGCSGAGGCAAAAGNRGRIGIGAPLGAPIPG